VELFETNLDSQQPLAARMRPRNLEEYVGQGHILAPGRLLWRAIQTDRLGSLIFYGPPGTGKTTLAKVIAGHTKSHFASLNAVLSGVKDIREVIEQAKNRRKFQEAKTILFVDEVHRWNKAQQDALLPWVENGTFVLIGATTENPYFEVNSALVSRSRIFQLLPLTEEDLRNIAWGALKDPQRGYGQYQITLEPEALEHLIATCEGDARSLLNALELAVEGSGSYPPGPGQSILIDVAAAEESIQRKVVLYDKDGDYHYDTISAFIKSLRGSDPDASLYWLARMVRAGESPRFIFRRMLILASEDIGLADPNAITVVESCASAFDRVGLPEGQFHLAQAALYLANTAKSNTTLGYFDALGALEEEKIQDVPSHLKDGNRDKEAFGHGQGYIYPHAFRDHWVGQQYLPSGLQKKIFYHPSDQGWEGQRKDLILQRREVLLEKTTPQSQETLSFAKGDKEWQKRLSEDKNLRREAIRSWFFGQEKWPRHARVFIPWDDGGVLTMEALRRFPEGGVWVCLPDEEDRRALEDFLVTVPGLNKPVILPFTAEDAFDQPWPGHEDKACEIIFAAGLPLEADFPGLPWERILTQDGQIKFLISNPLGSTRLSELIPPQKLSSEDLGLLRQVEERYLEEKTHPFLLGDAQVPTDWQQDILTFETDMRISGETWRSWFDAQRPGSLGMAIKKALTDSVIKTLNNLPSPGDITWRRAYRMFRRP
jgi:putative ATPase